MSKAITQIHEIFSSSGILSNKIPGYSPRIQQIEMALAVTQALENYEVLIAEAGTGTGKTYAYLIPSLISGKKVIISTGTKNLQDQLFHRDIPIIQKALGIPIKISILKGRSNYVCLHRLNTYLQADFLSSQDRQSLYQVKRFVETSHDGEIEHIAEIKADHHLLPYMTSTTENCLGQDCEFFSKCFVVKARRQALEAGLLIVNHHLFFADNQLKDSRISELLPDSHAVIFDEAHQLHEIATHFLGESLSGRQLTFLARDIKAEQQIDASDMLELAIDAELLILATKELHQSFGGLSKGNFDSIVHKAEMKNAVQKLNDVLIRLERTLEKVSIRGRGLENCWRRTADFMQKFKRLTTSFSEEEIYWFEKNEHNFSINTTPIKISDYFERLIEESTRAWIFTSATLSVGNDFTHFENALGLSKAKSLKLNSPFDYKKQALLYIPKINAFPNDEFYNSAMLAAVVPILELTEGRAFFLFTSHKALKETAMLLSNKINYPLLIQGSMPKSQLLSTFCERQNAILLGTSSFWEGVDVKGSQLSCVIIDKLPFSAPDDPILKIRFDHYKKQGKNPFFEYQLPQAVISLRQGAGRLIRDIEDRGLLVICDPRLLSKDYGKIFLNSLPPMTMTQSLQEVSHFFNEFSI